MKTIFNRADLFHALSLAERVIPHKTPKPVLACIKLVAGANREAVNLYATDQGLFLRATIETVQVERPGELLVPLRTLLAVIEKIPHAIVTIESGISECRVSTLGHQFTIYIDGELAAFPVMPEIVGEPDFVLDDIEWIVRQTVFAAALESTGYSFNGCLVDLKKGKLTFAATDGRRLAIANAVPSSCSNEDVSRVVPVAALNLAAEAMQSDEPISIQLKEDRATFSTKNIAIISPIVDGTFPPYKDVIPKSSDKKLTVSTADLLHAAEAAAFGSDNEMRLDCGSHGVHLSARTAGEIEVNLELEGQYEGDPIVIGFRPKFVVDMAGNAPHQTVTIEMTHPNRVGLFKSGPDFQCVIMPVKL